MFGSMPVLKHGSFQLAQSMAVSQYAADLGINLKSAPTIQQRAYDMMMLSAHADLQKAMYAGLLGDPESNAKGMAELAGRVKPILEGVERMHPSEGPFLYRKEGPSVGDLAILDFVCSPFPGLKALGIDLSGYAKINKVVEACFACQEGNLQAVLQASGFKR